MGEWEQVRKKGVKTESVVNAARRQGIAVETQAKFGGGSNRQHVVTKSTAKLDRETEELKHETVPLDLGKTIMQARQAKGMSQKELATKICEKPQIVNDYEAGRGIPNNLVIGKIERALQIKLRGKDRGRPLPPPGASKFLLAVLNRRKLAPSVALVANQAFQRSWKHDLAHSANSDLSITERVDACVALAQKWMSSTPLAAKCCADIEMSVFASIGFSMPAQGIEAQVDMASPTTDTKIISVRTALLLLVNTNKREFSRRFRRFTAKSFYDLSSIEQEKLLISSVAISSLELTSPDPIAAENWTKFGLRFEYVLAGVRALLEIALSE